MSAGLAVLGSAAMQAAEYQKFRRRIQLRVVPCLIGLFFCIILAYSAAISHAVKPRVPTRFLLLHLSKAFSPSRKPLEDAVVELLGGLDELPPEPSVKSKTKKAGREPRHLAHILRMRRLLSLEDYEEIIDSPTALPPSSSFSTSPTTPTSAMPPLYDDEGPETQCKIADPGNGSSSDQFPPDLFTLDERRRGAILLHVAGLIYMFVALAVVCDEFFVPALTVLTEVLEISDDVAGATFMAAGGSAPEFFTSVFGVFITQNNVGIGTIVGSATFNILCVLAFCTLFSREVLHLTWWPLFRDMSFYIVGLLFLLIFFTDEKIEWHEALTMFLLYILYGLFMKYNEELEMAVKSRLFNLPRITQTPGSRQTSNRGSISKHSSLDCPPEYRLEHRKSIPLIHSGSAFRNGIVHMAFEEEQEGAETEGTPAAPTSHPNAPANVIMVKPAGEHLNVAGGPNPKATRAIATVSGAVANNSSKSNGITPVENNSNHIENGHGALPQANGKKLEPSGPAEDVRGRTTQDLPLQAISNSSADGAQRPMDLSWPATMHKRIVYVLLIPIMLPLYLTLPDMRVPSRRKLFVITFCGSIIWIAFFSYLMVWWANTIGETLGIPTEVSLISSRVIVARKGLGDMAVSSSIGSNLFDICVGLPVPWLLHFIVGFFRGTGEPVPVISRGLICSVGTLFLMLILLVVTIAASKWRMDKCFGLLMIVGYVGFCILSVLLETGHFVCPLRTAGAAC